MSSIQVHDKFIDQVFSDPKNLRDFMQDLLPENLSSKTSRKFGIIIHYKKIFTQ